MILTAADGSAPQIGMPLLAFLGDWTSAPILDRANWFDEPQDGENVMNNDCTWASTWWAVPSAAPGKW